MFIDDQDNQDDHVDSDIDPIPSTLSCFVQEIYDEQDNLKSSF